MSVDLDDLRCGKTQVIASVSGGKDSTAMCLRMKELGVPYRPVFLDTGWEHPDTYEYIRGPLAEAIGDVEEIRGALSMPELIKKKGMFPGRTARFCTQELKIFPMRDYASALDFEFVNAVGIRSAESRARANMQEWEWADWLDAYTWRPLIDWSEQDVIDIHRKHGVAPNPLYLRGSERVGCWPCIYGRKSEIVHVADDTPWRIDEIRELERQVGDAAEARAIAAGTTLEEKGHHRPTFFCPSSKSADLSGSLNRMVPIDRVVEWARTDRGGRQMMLIDKAPPGCMRWGLCDAPPSDDGDPR